MRIVFMGTPEFAAHSLLKLSQSHEVALVVTQPDRPFGRGYKLTPPPVKVVATECNLPLLQPERINKPEIIAKLKELRPEAIVVVAFGQKIPLEILELAPYGCINLHGSLLPKYRGAAPIQRAIMNGESKTGLTTMLMDEGWDTGDMLLKCELPIELEDTAGTMHDKMMLAGANLLIETLEKLSNKEITPLPQDHAKATNAPKITKADQIISWDRSALTVFNHLRALLPWPGIKFIHNNRELSLEEISLGSRLESKKPRPGSVTEVTPEYFAVSCSDQTIRFAAIKPQGRRLMRVEEYLNGYNLRVGDFFEPLKEEN